MAKYSPPTLTVDAVIFQLDDDGLKVLVINRAKEPFMNFLALPGSYSSAGETSIDSFNRTLNVKAGLNPKQLKVVEQLYTFDTIARDPRGHAISITYMGLGRNLVIGKSATSEKPAFLPISDLPPLAFDHNYIVDYALARLRSKMAYTNMIFALMPLTFTLTELQKGYESVLGRKLDKRNFRKKIMAYGILVDSGVSTEGSAHRPAKLYKFKESKLEYLARTVD
jgi:8-oxo-dGTP diphosphatase